MRVWLFLSLALSPYLNYFYPWNKGCSSLATYMLREIPPHPPSRRYHKSQAIYLESKDSQKLSCVISSVGANEVTQLMLLSALCPVPPLSGARHHCPEALAWPAWGTDGLLCAWWGVCAPG